MDNTFLKNTFSKVIHDYEIARPTYPKELYEKILSFSKIGTGADVLEVGAGTGQATELFLDSHVKLDLLEVSDEQVAYLEYKYRKNENVTVKKNYFEDYICNKKYDLIYSATAFHWVKSEIGYPKAWDMLKKGGTLAVFWQMSSVTRYDTDLFSGLNELKKKYLPNESLGFDKDGLDKVREKRIAQIKTGGYFSTPEIQEFRWKDTYDAERYATLINTYSSTQTLSKDKREAYLEDIKKYINLNGGVVELPQLVMLYLVQKK